MRRALSNAPFVFAGVFNFYDSLNVGAQAYLRILYALFAISLAVAVVAGKRGAISVRSIMMITGVLALGLVPTPLHATSQTVHIVGDAAVLLALVLAVLLGEMVVRDPDSFRPGLFVFFALSLGGALAATQFVSFGRFEPAPPFVLSVLVTYAMFGRRPNIRMLASVGACLIAALGFLSGFRTFSLLVVVAVAIVIYTSGGVFKLIRYGAAAIFVLIMLTFAGINPAEPLISNEAGRLGSIASGDASVSARFLEAGDVLETAADEWGVVNYIVGSGVGSTYQPNRVFLAPNLDENGRVHNVHIGPIGVLFRHGVLGLLLLVLYWRRIRQAVVGLRRNRSFLLRSAKPSDLWLASLMLTAPLYAVDFLARNSSVNPGFALSLGAVIGLARVGGFRSTSASVGTKATRTAALAS